MGQKSEHNRIRCSSAVVNTKIAFCVASELEPVKDFFFLTSSDRLFFLLTEQLFPSHERTEKHSLLPLDPIPRRRLTLHDATSYLHKRFDFSISRLPTDRSRFCDNRQQEVQRLCVAETNIHNIYHPIDWILQCERYGKMKL